MVCIRYLDLSTFEKTNHMAKMRIDPREHYKHQWKAHTLLSDFKIEDVWRLPVILQPEHNLALVQAQFSKATAKIESRGPAGLLFRLRFFLGRLFKWDEKVRQTGIVPGSIRERYARMENLVYEQLPDPGNGNFTPVYTLDEESLAEIENATVHAAIHLGRVPLNDNTFTVQMTIYVKAKGVLGHLYMLLIKPFRWLIVYPTLMRVIKNQWESYLKSLD
jgi:hypothetical protein